MTDTETGTFGDVLRRYRLAAGLTQKALADRAGISARAVSDLERDSARLPRPETVNRLAAALELDPDETRALRAARHPPEDCRAGLAPIHPPSSLPVPITPLLGRERELTDVAAFLQRGEVRLLTLTGLGGVGKTRLAVALAHAVEAAYPDGVSFVDLAPFGDPALLPDILLHALGLREARDRSALDTVKRALGAQQRLLVLDNFEQILPAAAAVVELLASCPRLTVLVTSRAPLRVRGEHLVVVPPLELDAAVALFLERTRALQSDLVLTAAEEAAVAGICRRLDGLPLAIELAAARGRELPPQELLAHLDRRLTLLTRGYHDLPERQQTLRATLNWSYGLLSPEAQRLFRRLAVFRGRFTREAARAVDQSPDDEGVLASIGELLDQSLIERRGERFLMLETVREFAAEQLVASGEDDEAQAASLGYFLERAEAGDAAVTRTGWEIVALEMDLPNLRAALEWALRHRPEAALQFAGALGYLWYFQGHYREGVRGIEAALAAVPDPPLALAARALGSLSVQLQEIGSLEQARSAAERSLALYRALGDRDGQARQLNNVGLIDAMENQLDRAAAEFETSRQLFQEEGRAAGSAVLLTNLGWVSVLRGDRPRATEALAASLTLARAGGNRGYHGWARVNQGRLDLVAGQSARARDRFIEALDLEALRVSGLSVPPRIVVSALYGLAAIAATEHDAVRAAHLLGTADALCEATGFVVWPAEQSFHARYLAPARVRLGDDEWRRAWEAGKALSLGEALAEARARPVTPSRTPRNGLSAREREVLLLVAQGQTDAEVAERLYLSRRTVSQHLRSIYNKLGVNSRLAATRFALDHHLV